MPRNYEFLIAAFGIAIAVVSVYYLRTLIKLRSVQRKLQELEKRDDR